MAQEQQSRASLNRWFSVAEGSFVPLSYLGRHTHRARYNYTGEDFFVKKKDRGFRHVTSTAKLVIREALPIQCVEAVFVGAYLTADMAQVNQA